VIAVETNDERARSVYDRIGVRYELVE